MVMFKMVCLHYITNINILTQVLTVFQIVEGVRIAHSVTSGCAAGWVTWESLIPSRGKVFSLFSAQTHSGDHEASGY